MIGYLILLILLFSLVTALCNGQIDNVCTQLLASPQKAVELSITIGCSICLWSGVMQVAQDSGLLKGLSKLFSPLLRLLFPSIKKESKAAQAVCLNLAANLLGLGAAAAPAGICAVQEFQKMSPSPSIATDNSILLILLNTASLQLIPTTAAMLRLQAGSAAPMEILPAVWMASVLSVCTGVLAAKTMCHLCSPLQQSSGHPAKRRAMP